MEILELAEVQACSLLQIPFLMVSSDVRLIEHQFCHMFRKIFVIIITLLGS